MRREFSINFLTEERRKPLNRTDGKAQPLEVCRGLIGMAGILGSYSFRIFGDRKDTARCLRDSLVKRMLYLCLRRENFLPYLEGKEWVEKEEVNTLEGK
jgi:hypothetical protein